MTAKYVVRRKRPVLKAALLALVGVVLWTGGHPGAVYLEAALVVAWMARGLIARKPSDVDPQVAELAEQVTELAGECLRYKALLAAVLVSYPEGFKIDRDTAEAATRLEVYVAPTADGGIMASAGYPTRAPERRPA